MPTNRLCTSEDTFIVRSCDGCTGAQANDVVLHRRGLGNNGQPLSASHVDLLRSAVVSASPPEVASAWQALPDDAAFLASFSTALVSNPVSLGTQSVIVPEQQRLLFAAAAAAVMDAGGAPAGLSLFGGGSSAVYGDTGARLSKIGRASCRERV